MQFAWGGCSPLASANLRECQIAELKASLWPAEKHGSSRAIGACDVRIGTTQRAIALSALTGMCRWNRLADPGSRLMQCDRDDCVPLAPTNRQESQIAELKASLCPTESTEAAARSEYLRGAHWNQHARIALSALASMRRWNGLVDRHKTASLRIAVCRLKV